jgi:hypothetical protein
VEIAGCEPSELAVADAGQDASGREGAKIRRTGLDQAAGFVVVQSSYPRGLVPVNGRKMRRAPTAGEDHRG